MSPVCPKSINHREEEEAEQLEVHWKEGHPAPDAVLDLLA